VNTAFELVAIEFDVQNSVVAKFTDGASSEGFGADVAPFVDLDQAFAATHGAEADIGLRQVSAAQCPAVDLVRTLVGPNFAEIPSLELQGDILRPGQATPLRGSLPGTEGQVLRLVLIDDQGGSYDITGLLRARADGTPVFDLAVQVAARPDAPEIRPHLILVVATEARLDSVVVTPGASVFDVAQSLKDAMGALPGPVSATLGYFRLEES